MPALAITGIIQATVIAVALIIEEAARLRQGNPVDLFFFAAELVMSVVANYIPLALIVLTVWALANKRRKAADDPEAMPEEPASPARHSRPVLIATGLLVLATALMGAMTPFSIVLIFATPGVFIGGVVILGFAFTKAGHAARDEHAALRVRLHAGAVALGITAIAVGFALQQAFIDAWPFPLALVALQMPLVLTLLATFGSAAFMLRYGGGRRDHAGLAAAVTAFTSVAAFAGYWFYLAAFDLLGA